LPYAQEIEYAEETPTLQEWRRLNAEGKLNDVQRFFFSPTKPVEELYDTQIDPHETRNLANDPAVSADLGEDADGTFPLDEGDGRCWAHTRTPNLQK
jgi:N-sulfoglucosamine sulfohydrolase